MSHSINIFDLSAARLRVLDGSVAEPGCVPGRPRPRLLVVDDEPTVGRMMAHAAEECGYRAAVAISASGFRAQYDADPPALILLDLSLPGGDGIELLRFLAERKSQSLILIVSGFDRRVVEAARRLGEALGLRMGDCLTKPVFVRELETAIEGSLLRADGPGAVAVDAEVQEGRGRGAARVA
jgi:DNA-binding response OmpR family regulator